MLGVHGTAYENHCRTATENHSSQPVCMGMPSSIKSQWCQKWSKIAPTEQLTWQSTHTPPGESTVYNGWGWMSSIHVTLQTVAPLCIEQQVSILNCTVGWLSRELKVNDNVNCTPKHWWDSFAHVGTVPTDLLPGKNIWICGEVCFYVYRRLQLSVFLCTDKSNRE